MPAVRAMLTVWDDRLAASLAGREFIPLERDLADARFFLGELFGAAHRERDPLKMVGLLLGFGCNCAEAHNDCDAEKERQNPGYHVEQG